MIRVSSNEFKYYRVSYAYEEKIDSRTDALMRISAHQRPRNAITNHHVVDLDLM